MLWRWAIREIRRNWRSCLFFVLNLSFGLMGFISLEAYKDALQNHVEANRREILGGDIEVSARREFTEAEQKSIADVLAGSPTTTIYQFFAMVSSAQGSRLIQVKAVDAAYPLYGKITLADGSALRLERDGAWIYPELAEQLDLSVGSPLKIGNLNLTVKGLVTEDTAQTFRAAGFAPNVYIDRARLADSGLIQFGSTFSRRDLARLPEAAPTDELRKRLETAITDPAVSIETADQAGEDSARQLDYLSDFLGLVALVGLFLAALGAAYLWRLFLQQRARGVAILRSLGVDGNRAVLLYLIEAGVLGVAALIPALIGAQIIFPFLNEVLAELTPFRLRPVLSLSSVLTGLCLSVGTSVLVTLPFLLRLREISPASLFNESKFDPSLEIRRPWAFLPAGAGLWVLAIVQSKSIWVGSLFAGALAGVLLALVVAGWLFLRLLRGLRAGPWDIKHGLRSAARRPAASLSIFIALGLGTLLMNILPQIKVSLQKEFSVESTSLLPSLFMFDIQDEQLPRARELISKHGAELSGLSPLIRARILKVNDANYERAATAEGFKTREEEREARFRNRGVNLSYRTELSTEESLSAGTTFSGPWHEADGKPVELSVEEGYADRMGLKIGDHLLFDVQGVEIQGVIINLRKVKWTTFQPNFFVLIQNGVLDEAPKTWIASTRRLPDATKKALENDLASTLANVSVIDVERTVSNVLKTAEQMSWALEFMAALSVITGAAVLYSIARSQVRGRRWELNLLKVLGAGESRVRRYILAEFALLAGFSAFLGAFLSLVVSAVLLKERFGIAFSVDWLWILGSGFGVTAVGVLVAERACAAVIKEKPLQIFREET